eukprot:scaffold19.g1770.t1
MWTKQVAGVPLGTAPQLSRLRPAAGAAEQTVPLRRAVVEDMLVDRLTARVHSMSDAELAELLERLLAAPQAPFPSELLRPASPAGVAPPPPQPAAAAPAPPAPQLGPPPAAPSPIVPHWQQQLQQLQRVMPQAPQPGPGAASSSVVGGGMIGSGSSVSSSSSSSSPSPSTAPPGIQEAEAARPPASASSGGGGGDPTGAAAEEADATDALLQQFKQAVDVAKEQRAAQSGATGSAISGGAAGAIAAAGAYLTDGGNVRLLLVGLSAPLALIAAYGQLNRWLSEGAQSDAQQAGAPPDAAAGQVAEAQRREGRGSSWLALLPFVGGASTGSAASGDAGTPARDAVDAAVNGAASGADVPPASSGWAEEGQQQQQQQQAAPPPPPPLPMNASAPGDQGSVLWRRREDPEVAASSGASGERVLWRRQEPEEQAAPPASSGAGGTRGHTAMVAQAAAASMDDPWRMPLGQLQAAAAAAAASASASANGSSREAAPSPSGAPTQVQQAGAAAEANGAGSQAGLGRRIDEERWRQLLDNAEPGAATQFVDAVNQLGVDKAVPKRILDIMKVDGLTRENVASHLQKYRLYLKRAQSMVNGRSGRVKGTMAEVAAANAMLAKASLACEDGEGGGAGLVAGMPAAGAGLALGQAAGGVPPVAPQAVMAANLAMWQQQQQMAMQQMQQMQAAAAAGGGMPPPVMAPPFMPPGVMVPGVMMPGMPFVAPGMLPQQAAVAAAAAASAAAAGAGAGAAAASMPPPASAAAVAAAAGGAHTTGQAAAALAAAAAGAAQQHSGGGSGGHGSDSGLTSTNAEPPSVADTLPGAHLELGSDALMRLGSGALDDAFLPDLGSSLLHPPPLKGHPGGDDGYLELLFSGPADQL